MARPEFEPPTGKNLLDQESREKLPELYSGEEQGLDALAHHTGCAGWTISSMDRLAMPLLGDITGSFRLVVQ